MRKIICMIIAFSLLPCCAALADAESEAWFTEKGHELAALTQVFVQNGEAMIVSSLEASPLAAAAKATDFTSPATIAFFPQNAVMGQAMLASLPEGMNQQLSDYLCTQLNAMIGTQLAASAGAEVLAYSSQTSVRYAYPTPDSIKEGAYLLLTYASDCALLVSFAYYNTGAAIAEARILPADVVPRLRDYLNLTLSDFLTD